MNKRMSRRRRKRKEGKGMRMERERGEWGRTGGRDRQSEIHD